MTSSPDVSLLNFVMPVHPLKAYDPMDVAESERLTEVMPTHPLKAFEPIETTLDGKATSPLVLLFIIVSDEQPSKAESPIVFNPLGKTTFVTPVMKAAVPKAAWPVMVTDLIDDGM